MNIPQTIIRGSFKVTAVAANLGIAAVSAVANRLGISGSRRDPDQEFPLQVGRAELAEPLKTAGTRSLPTDKPKTRSTPRKKVSGPAKRTSDQVHKRGAAGSTKETQKRSSTPKSKPGEPSMRVTLTDSGDRHKDRPSKTESSVKPQQGDRLNPTLNRSVER